VAEAPPPQPPPQQVTEVQPVPPVPESVFFSLDKSEITTQGAVTLKNQAEFLKQNPDRKVQISGYTDERGSDEYNQKLGQERADAVKGHLAQLGINADRMTTASYGKEKPVCTESTESCHAANRRVDLDVTG
jgi:peptidoglycan-associated lipoprotein